jgi:AraC-like DNA-binding protein
MFSTTNAFALSDEQGRIRVDTADLHMDGLRASRVQSTGHTVDLTEEISATVLFPMTGQLRVRVAAAEYRISTNAICMFGPNSRRTRTEAPSKGDLFQANALMMPYDAVQRLWQADPDQSERWPGLPDSLPIPARLSEAQRLSELLGYCVRHFDDGAPPLSDKGAVAMATLVEELLAQLILRCCSTSADDSLMPAAKRRVAMAEEIMRARSDEPLSMAKVAREVGVGLRSLELAFVATRAMGPRDALVRIRLERVRERLQAAGPAQTVTSIALDCGFAHLGRFSAAYRKAFGESPSDTLASAWRKNA